jgi:hypothetical protein
VNLKYVSLSDISHPEYQDAKSKVLAFYLLALKQNPQVSDWFAHIVDIHVIGDFKYQGRFPFMKSEVESQNHRYNRRDKSNREECDVLLEPSSECHLISLQVFVWPPSARFGVPKPS